MRQSSALRAAVNLVIELVDNKERRPLKDNNDQKRARVCSPTIHHSVPLPKMVTFVQRGAAGGASETRHMINQLARSHHQFRGGDTGVTSRAPGHREQPATREKSRESRRNRRETFEKPLLTFENHVVGILVTDLSTRRNFSSRYLYAPPPYIEMPKFTNCGSSLETCFHASLSLEGRIYVGESELIRARETRRRKCNDTLYSLASPVCFARV